MQEEVPAGTFAFGMGGITMPPSDLCISWSLQCRYCREICTWGQRWGRLWSTERNPHRHPPPRPLTQSSHCYPEPPGRWCWEVASGFHITPGPPESSVLRAP